MPTSGMWTNGEKDAINSWVQAHVPGYETEGIDNFSCQICQQPCTLQDYVAGTGGQGILGLTLGATRANSFALLCGQCGFQHLFDNAVIGIF